jgi:hypothetical protein
MSELGQKLKSSDRANVFRSTPDNGHSSAELALGDQFLTRRHHGDARQRNLHGGVAKLNHDRRHVDRHLITLSPRRPVASVREPNPHHHSDRINVPMKRQVWSVVSDQPTVPSRVIALERTSAIDCRIITIYEF